MGKQQLFLQENIGEVIFYHSVSVLELLRPLGSDAKVLDCERQITRVNVFCLC